MSDVRLPLGPAPIVPDEESVISRILAHVEPKTTDMCPGTHVESTDIYVDAARLAREKEAVFRRTPTLIASSAELRGEDAYLARRFLGTPFLIVAVQPQARARRDPRGGEGRAGRLTLAARAMTLKIETISSPGLRLIGRIRAEELPALRSLIREHGACAPQ